MNKAEIGVVGLGTMGANVARNFANHKIPTVVYNRSYDKTADLIAAHGGEHLFGTETLADFVSKLAMPRKVLLMVTAGPAVDAVIEELLPLLSDNDIIIDGGNSLFSDTQKRTNYLSSKRIQYLGMGISGGEEGALHGPSMMAGLPSSELKPLLQPLFEQITARDFQGNGCVGWFTGPGSGHYVKMIHNGIEYAIMQLIAETYQLLRKGKGLDADRIAETFAQWQKGKLNSYLIDITAQVLAKKDDDGKTLVDKIKDRAGQKGTGQWTVQDAFERGVPVPSIATAVEARQISSFFDTRMELAKMYQWDLPTNIDLDVNVLENALYVAIIGCYIQGLTLIQTAAKEQGWKINLAEVVTIWQGGCIIRAELLKDLVRWVQDVGEKHLLTIPAIQTVVKSHVNDWRATLIVGLQANASLSCFHATYQYLLAMTEAHGSANLIQGLRDYFGAHTYERLDKDGIFHSQWQ